MDHPSISALALVVVGCGSAGGSGADGSPPIGMVDAGSVVDASAGPDGPPADCAMPVRILTFNLLHGFPDFANLDARTQIVVNAITALQPDLVAFQEIAQSFASANRAEVIAASTGYSWTWAQATGVAGVFQAGPGILTRVPFTLTREFELPRPIIEDLVTRKLVEVRLALPCGEVGFFSTHIGEIDDLDPTFVPDLTTAVYTIMLEEAVDGANFLGAGINATPDRDSIKVLIGDATYNGITGTLTDVWTTASTEPGKTYPSHNPSQRLDYIFMLDGAGATTTVESCTNVLADEIDGVRPSDHIGVLCDVRVVVPAQTATASPAP